MGLRNLKLKKKPTLSRTKKSKVTGKGIHPRHIIKKQTKKAKFKSAQQSKANYAQARLQRINTGFLGLVAFSAVTDVYAKLPSSSKSTELSKVSSSSSDIKGEFWWVCTGNTCRSAALKMAAYEKGVVIPTCGSGVRSSGGMTPALLDAYDRGNFTKDFLKVAHSHRSKSCGKEEECDLFKDNARIFGVVAESNKRALQALSTSCGLPNPTIYTLGEIAEECKSLEDDPWDYSEQAAIEDGVPWTDALKRRQQNVYDNLPSLAAKCFDAVTARGQHK